MICLVGAQWKQYRLLPMMNMTGPKFYRKWWGPIGMQGMKNKSGRPCQEAGERLG